MPGAGVRVGACMLYGGIKIEAEQSIIVIVDEQNKLFIQHDIVIDNTESGIKNFLRSMQQGGIKPTDICFAISPGHIKNAPAFKLFVKLWQSAGYELRLINIAAADYNKIVVTKSRGADEETTGVAIYLKKYFGDTSRFLDENYRLSYVYNSEDLTLWYLALYLIFFGDLLFNFHGFSVLILVPFTVTSSVSIVNNYRRKKLRKQNMPAYVISRQGVQYCIEHRWFGPKVLQPARFYSWDSIDEIKQNEVAFWHKGRQSSFDNERTFLLYIRQQPTVYLNFWYMDCDADEVLSVLQLYKQLFSEAK